MQLSLAFEMRPVENNDLKMVTYGLLIPNKSVDVQLIDRKV